MDCGLYILTKRAIALPPLYIVVHRRFISRKSLSAVCPHAYPSKRISALCSSSFPSSDLRVVEDVETVSEACCTVGENVVVNPFDQTASLVRGVMLIKPTTTILRRVISRRGMTRPPTFLAVVFTAFLYAMMTVKAAIQSKCRSCQHCGGFGITRCDLCEGHRVIWWEGKYRHIEPCPKCYGKRYVRCPKCGGLFGRAIFSHKTQEPLDAAKLAELEKEANVDESWVGAPRYLT